MRNIFYLKNSFLFLTLFVFSLFIPLKDANANELIRPRVIIYKNVSVRNKEIKLSDISKIITKDPSKKEFVKRLKNIKIANAPAPKTNITLFGVNILKKISDTGISLDSFGYSIPKVITITREGREITKKEVMEAIKKELNENLNFDIIAKDVNWKHSQIIPIGKTSIKAKILSKPQKGRILVNVTAKVNNEIKAKFLATCLVDDWRKIPVVKRTLERGMIIKKDDIELVRLNLFKEPYDTLSNPEEVIGLRVKSRISPGNVIRKSKVSIPKTIERGKRVTLLYRINGFEARAIGVSMEEGLKGENIRVRNIDSKRILIAKVLDRETVEVFN